MSQCLYKSSLMCTATYLLSSDDTFHCVTSCPGALCLCRTLCVSGSLLLPVVCQQQTSLALRLPHRQGCLCGLLSSIRGGLAVAYKHPRFGAVHAAAWTQTFWYLRHHRGNVTRNFLPVFTLISSAT